MNTYIRVREDTLEGLNTLANELGCDDADEIIAFLLDEISDNEKNNEN